MIPSTSVYDSCMGTVYQRGLVIDSQLDSGDRSGADSISKGIGD